MTLDENTPTDRDRSDYVLWDYPLEDKFTKMYFTMKDAGFVPSVEHAVKMARNANRSYGGRYRHKVSRADELLEIRQQVEEEDFETR